MTLTYEPDLDIDIYHVRIGQSSRPQEETTPLDDAVRMVNAYAASVLCRMRLYKLRRNYSVAGSGWLAHTWEEPAGLVAKAVGASASDGSLVYLLHFA